MPPWLHVRKRVLAVVLAALLAVTLSIVLAAESAGYGEDSALNLRHVITTSLDEASPGLTPTAPSCAPGSGPTPSSAPTCNDPDEHGRKDGGGGGGAKPTPAPAPSDADTSGTGDDADGEDSSIHWVADAHELRQALASAKLSRPAGRFSSAVAPDEGRAFTDIFLSSAIELERPITIHRGSKVRLLSDAPSHRMLSAIEKTGLVELEQGSVLELHGLYLFGGVADRGGAIRNRGGSLTVSNCTMANNTAEHTGGAIFSDDGDVMLHNSTFVGNRALQAGGAFYANRRARASLAGVTFLDNEAPAGADLMLDLGRDKPPVVVLLEHLSHRPRMAALAGLALVIMVVYVAFAQQLVGGLFKVESSRVAFTDTLGLAQVGLVGWARCKARVVAGIVGGSRGGGCGGGAEPSEADKQRERILQIQVQQRQQEQQLGILIRSEREVLLDERAAAAEAGEVAVATEVEVEAEATVAVREGGAVASGVLAGISHGVEVSLSVDASVDVDVSVDPKRQAASAAPAGAATAAVAHEGLGELLVPLKALDVGALVGVGAHSHVFRASWNSPTDSSFLEPAPPMGSRPRQTSCEIMREEEGLSSALVSAHPYRRAHLGQQVVLKRLHWSTEATAAGASIEGHGATTPSSFMTSITTSQELMDRWRNEANIWRRLSHPNICRLVGVVCEATRFVPPARPYTPASSPRGGSSPLASVMASHTAAAGRAGGGSVFGVGLVLEWLPLSLGDALAMASAAGPGCSTRGGGGGGLEFIEGHHGIQIALETARALAYLHSTGVVHRDVKSSNLLLSGDGTAHLSDFGQACILGASQRVSAGSPAGTLLYSAPEQLRGDAHGASVDSWSLGMVLAEVLSGRQVFELWRHTHDPPTLDLGLGHAPVQVPATVTPLSACGWRPGRRMIMGNGSGPSAHARGGASASPARLARDDLMSILEACWSSDPADRPSLLQIVARLEHHLAHFPPRADSGGDGSELELELGPQPASTLLTATSAQAVTSTAAALVDLDHSDGSEAGEPHPAPSATAGEGGVHNGPADADAAEEAAHRSGGHANIISVVRLQPLGLGLPRNSSVRPKAQDPPYAGGEMLMASTSYGALVTQPGLAHAPPRSFVRAMTTTRSSSTEVLSSAPAKLQKAVAVEPAVVVPSPRVALQSTGLQQQFRKSWGDWFDMPVAPTHTPLVLPPAAPLGLEKPGLGLEARGSTTTAANEEGGPALPVVSL